MRLIERLKHEAKEGASWRGHDMSRFNKNLARCKICKAEAYVDAKPPPNGINISGTAVALNCPVDPRWL